MTNRKKLFDTVAGRRVFTVLIVLLAAVGALVSFHLYNIYSGYQSAREEYDELRDIAYVVIAPAPGEEPEAILSADIDLKEINPSYVCWLKIEGTEVDYPVVQGQDNEYYMYRTFRGERNASGTPFMDVLCPGGLSAPMSIIYGHNMHDGSMFSVLHDYHNDSFFFSHPYITITPYDSDPITYVVFAVLSTDVYDPIFSLRGADFQEVFNYCSEIGKPSGSGSVLVLSTCTTGGTDDDRLLVVAAQVETEI